MKNIELLAPAGNMESLYAAVQGGADAVYLGGNKFSARAYASNFDEENIIKAVDYCHLYGVKVYVTLNTLLKESEIKEALDYTCFLYKIGVDALIIQDTGLAYIIRKNLPDFEIHASTQMTVHNGEGALFLKNLGFKRIVLSRELSLEEIIHISKDLGIETEIFIHGALCICYSGQCLMSSIIGGRSGNRGRCAQPCRLYYTLIDKNNLRESSAYILSPKDICTLSDIKKIINSGAASLKIEGRMKRPEYVAGVVSLYRKAIDSIYNNTAFDFENENKKLLKLFNREGFSKAYLFGNKGKDMMAYKFPKNTGIEIGEAIKNSLVKLKEDISIGDGIRVKEEGFTLSKIIKNGEEVEKAFKGDLVKLLPLKYKNGDIIFKTSDILLLKYLENYYKDIFERKISLSLNVIFKKGERLVIKTTYEGKEFIEYGDIVQSAIKKPLDIDKIKENLQKSKDTPFKFENIQFEFFEEGFLPLSSINFVRRELIEKIQNYIIGKSKRKLNFNTSYLANKNITTNAKKSKEVFVIVNNTEQIKAFIDSNINGVLVVDIFKKQNNLNLEDIKLLNYDKIYLKIPNIIKEEFNYICSIIEKSLPYIKGIVTSNLGIINKFNSNLSIIGDYKLNIFNSYSVLFYEKFLNEVCLSVELNKREIIEIVKNTISKIQMKIYGKEELMVSEYCPVGSILGGKCSNVNCKENCEYGNYVLKDRKGEEFILKTDKFCRSYIYNSVSTNLIPNLDEINNMNINSFRLDFIDENYEETLKILNAFKESKWPYDYKNFTRGHFKRGVE
ncbi:U32 family peptidase [Clostridium prolinivorans]|uniref:U32 family peptidase n=1 Tax=Clostridium prolinivorans TaxID=2769420 RepID=UPI000FDB52F5|nr:U32 family peptidase [Clostridium prolinivorans]